MALVYDRPTEGPGTHALIVGVPTSPTSAAPASAISFFQWLTGNFSNPTAPLASIEMLGAMGERPIILGSAPGDPMTRMSDLPTWNRLEKASADWAKRLHRDPDNIALFYFAGPLYRGSEGNWAGVWISDEYGSGHAAFDLKELTRALASWPPQRQLVLVDGHPADWEAEASRRSLLQPRPTHGGTRQVLIESSSSDRPFEVAEAGATSIFHRALIDTLHFVDEVVVPPTVTSTFLASRMNERCGAVISMVGESFDFHFMPSPSFDESSTGEEEQREAATEEPPSKQRERSGETPPPPPQDATEFVPDEAETERDALARGTLAIALARRLHRIWRQANGLEHDEAAAWRARHAGRPADEGAAFVIHIDAPWGGGKTTFANFIARVLNPRPGGAEAAYFLRRNREGLDLGGMFLADPPRDDDAVRRLSAVPPAARRPWIVVPFNAWQAEHCAPPWWVFYQAIRKGCFDAIRKEGDEPWTPRPPRDERPRWRRALDRAWAELSSRAEGTTRWLWLVAREYLWRLGNPKVLSIVLLGIAAAAVLGILALWEVIDPEDLKTWIPVLSGGLAGLWAIAAFFTESIAPGTATVAERLSLGAGDPFIRFRRHFSRMIDRVRRPVLVVVDDLDRCRPDFVVDLVRGMQTLLRSRRVVFLILGDRDWIERAFEEHHSKMKALDVGPEQSFGARFVEKAIQMSFILPCLEGESRDGYVREILLGAGGLRSSEAAAAAEADRAIESRATEKAEELVAAHGSAPIERAAAVSEVTAALTSDPDEAKPAPEVVERAVASVLAVNAAVDESAARHQLETLAGTFPANPRQIKRIVNAFAVYHASALQNRDIPCDEEFRFQLALWVILMTEWPRTWRLIASHAELADVIAARDWEKKLEALHKRDPSALPGDLAATREEIRRIRADPDLLALIGGEPPKRAPLKSEHAAALARLTPLHARRHRLVPSRATSETG